MYTVRTIDHKKGAYLKLLGSRRPQVLLTRRLRRGVRAGVVEQRNGVLRG